MQVILSQAGYSCEMPEKYIIKLSSNRENEMTVSFLYSAISIALSNIALMVPFLKAKTIILYLDEYNIS